MRPVHVGYTGTRSAPRSVVRNLTCALLLVAGCTSNPPSTDATPPDAWLLEELAPAEGVWIRTPEFAVSAGQEIQDCYFFDVPDLAAGDDLWIDHAKLALNTGSHHMNMFRVKTIVNLDPATGTPVAMGGVDGVVIHGADNDACWKAGNWADWPLVANSQQSGETQQVIDWNLPTGVAERFHPGEKLMVQIHYVNATDQVTPEVGRGGINLYRSHDGDAIELGTMFAAQKQIRVCRSQPTASYSARCKLAPGTHTIAAANGHFHSRGTKFQMWAWDGTSTTMPPDTAKFYENTDWGEPKMAIGLDVGLADLGGVWWTCDYEWKEPSVGCAALDDADPMHANDCCYVFGPSVEKNEHCNAFVYYYPTAATPPTCM